MGKGCFDVNIVWDVDNDVSFTGAYIRKWCLFHKEREDGIYYEVACSLFKRYWRSRCKMPEMHSRFCVLYSGYYYLVEDL